MKDEEKIIKALKGFSSKATLLYGANSDDTVTFQDVVNCITEQKAEIERLTEELDKEYELRKEYMFACEKKDLELKQLEFEKSELQKQVDELSKENKFLHATIQNAEPYREGCKDTAKEILQEILNIIKKSDGFLAQEVIRIMAKQRSVEVKA